VAETDKELFGTGDFDGDGRIDIVIFHRLSGVYQVGYQKPDGGFRWVHQLRSGVQSASGMAVGRFLEPNKDAVVFTSSDDNLTVFMDASRPLENPRIEPVPIESLGPNCVAGIELEGLFVSSIHNEPDPFRITLLRNRGGGKFAAARSTTTRPSSAQPPDAPRTRDGKSVIPGCPKTSGGSPTRGLSDSVLSVHWRFRPPTC